MKEEYLRTIPRGAASRPRRGLLCFGLPCALLLAAAELLASVGDARADLALETETARPLDPGQWQAGTALEYQRSRDGVEFAIPAFVEVGLRHGLELLVEPVFYTAILPSDGGDTRGVGDTEVTLTYLAREETCSFPALAIAGEVKLPTATERLIGTGKADFTGYLIASKRVGDFDVHFNFGYTVVGKPRGSDLQNIFNFALAAEYPLTCRVDLLAEVLVNTSSLSSGGGESSATPEASGGEVVGTVGVRYHVTDRADTFFDVSYDNQNALGLRVGFAWKF